LQDSKDEGKLGLGKKPPGKMKTPNENSATTIKETKQYPTESESKMKSEYSIQRTGMTPHEDKCTGMTTTTSKVQARSSLHTIEGTQDSGGDSAFNGIPRFDPVWHSFQGPELHDPRHEDHHAGTEEEIDIHVMMLLHRAVQSRHTETGEGHELISACKTDAVRKRLFGFLRANNTKSHRHNAAIKILGYAHLC
jgi:hypothetical protein